MEMVRESVEGVREEIDHVMRTGPVVTRAEGERLLRLMRLSAALIEGRLDRLPETRGAAAERCDLFESPPMALPFPQESKREGGGA
jgi:hypothetical protein